MGEAPGDNGSERSRGINGVMDAVAPMRDFIKCTHGHEDKAPGVIREDRRNPTNAERKSQRDNGAML